MDLQLAIVAVLVATATLYIAFAVWRTWAGDKNGKCGGGCGCASPTKKEDSASEVLIPSNQITLRRGDRQS
jgi:hypothetical protein